jgi:hypothetical protein
MPVSVNGLSTSPPAPITAGWSDSANASRSRPADNPTRRSHAYPGETRHQSEENVLGTE